MQRFIIEGKTVFDNYCQNHIVPAQDYGYTAIQAVDYYGWLNSADKDIDRYGFDLTNDITAKRYHAENYIPIGSVDFVLAWLKAMGVPHVAPLNIPRELWQHCKRDVRIDYCSNINGHWMLKDTDTIKAPYNGEVYFHGDGGKDKKYFLTRWVDDIDSEWRVFIFDKKILGIKCYSGDELIVPDRSYIEEIAQTYDKRCYVLDLFVRNNGTVTDICELHDFFACGLYGFDDLKMLPIMWSATIKELLKQR